jgi:hypothetical protein
MNKLKTTIIWVMAFVITLGIAKYQRTTGPTYPVDGEVSLGGHAISYSLKRTQGGDGDHTVKIELPDLSKEQWVEQIEGVVFWKHYKLDEPTRAIKMQLGGGVTEDGCYLSADLPHQPPAGKLEYQVKLMLDSEEVIFPEEAPVIRFKGAVPVGILLPHILMMFGALLVGMQTSISAFFGLKIKTKAMVTLGMIVVGGLILGPIVQKYAFGAYWTGWPLGGDWTDNKTAVMALGWIIALWMMRGRRGEQRGRWWVVAATVVMFAVYMIPHSTRGSELDYSAMPADSLEQVE